MANGLQVIGDAGNVQIDDTYSNLALVASGVATLVTGFGGTVSPGYNAVVSYVNPLPGTFPLIALRPHDSTGLFNIFKLTVSGSTFTWTIIAGDNPGEPLVNKSFDYFILNTPPVASPEAYGIQVFDSSGNKTFDSGYRYVRVLSVTTTTYTYLASSGGRTIETPHSEGIAFIPGSLSMQTDAVQEITGDIFYTYYYTIAGFRILSGSTLQIKRAAWGSETLVGSSDGSSQYNFRKEYCSVMAIALDPLI